MIAIKRRASTAYVMSGLPLDGRVSILLLGLRFLSIDGTVLERIFLNTLHLQFCTAVTCSAFTFRFSVLLDPERLHSP
jgi:hypothetical protein